jgi:tetratricopeptide (TPR) repeat protein
MNRKQRRAEKKFMRPETRRALPGVQELFTDALRYHQAGRLNEAERLCRQILALDSHHADSLHLLGLIAYQVGCHDLSVDLISKAIAINPRVASYHSNLGLALQVQGKLDQAVACYRRTLVLKSDYAETHNNLGNALRDQGKLDEAVACCRQALVLKPNLAGAHNNLGNALKDQGKLDEAVACYRQALALKPDYAEAHNNLGNALTDQGKLDEAVACCRRGLVLKPNYTEAHNNLGNALRGQGKLSEAVACYRRALALKPDSAEAHNNLGNAFRDQGKLDEAVACCRRALVLKPNYAPAHNNLGNALRDQGKLDEAVACYRQALALKPGYAEAHSNLSVALQDQGKFDDAVAVCRQAIILKPNLADAHNNLGLALLVLGQLSEAGLALEQAVRLAPRNAKYRRDLGEITHFVPGDPNLAAMEHLAQESASLSVGDQIELHFALAKAYEDVGRHAAAFRQWLDGNALRRRQIDYNEATTLGALDRARAVFTSDLIRTWQNMGDPSSLPVFIIGMPRSGTTLIEQILASHPQVFGGGELSYFHTAVEGIQTALGGSATFPELVTGMTGDNFRNLGGRYLAKVERLARNVAHITDKMPANFMYAGLIHLTLPNAPIIHTIRDPVDTCLSCFSKLFAAEQNHTYDLAELGRYYRHYQALMAHWHHVLPPGRILDVRYEDVVADLEGQARRIIVHCGLDWDPRCLAFHQTERPVRTASAMQVRQPIYNSAVGHWRVHEPFLGPLLAELGYVGGSNPGPTGPTGHNST